MRSYDCPNIAISLWFHPFSEKQGEEEMLDMEDETEDVRRATFKLWQLLSVLSEQVFFQYIEQYERFSF